MRLIIFLRGAAERSRPYPFICGRCPGLGEGRPGAAEASPPQPDRQWVEIYQQGKVGVKVSAGRKMADGEKATIFIVTDTGIGVPPDKRTFSSILLAKLILQIPGIRRHRPRARHQPPDRGDDGGSITYENRGGQLFFLYRASRRGCKRFSSRQRDRNPTIIDGNAAYPGTKVIPHIHLLLKMTLWQVNFLSRF